MVRIVQRIGDRALRMFLPERDAGACPCSPADNHYEYRCNTAVGEQRRWCTVSCNCSQSCGAWVTIMPHACF